MAARSVPAMTGDEVAQKSMKMKGVICNVAVFRGVSVGLGGGDHD